MVTPVLKVPSKLALHLNCIFRLHFAFLKVEVSSSIPMGFICNRQQANELSAAKVGLFYLIINFLKPI